MHNGWHAALTVVDTAPRLPDGELEAMINEADKLHRISPDSLRAALEDLPPLPGKARVRSLLDRHTFVLTDSALERLFIPIALGAGLPLPLTQQHVNGFRVDSIGRVSDWWLRPTASATTGLQLPRPVTIGAIKLTSPRG